MTEYEQKQQNEADRLERILRLRLMRELDGLETRNRELADDKARLDAALVHALRTSCDKTEELEKLKKSMAGIVAGYETRAQEHDALVKRFTDVEAELKATREVAETTVGLTAQVHERGRLLADAHERADRNLLAFRNLLRIAKAAGAVARTATLKDFLPAKA